MDLLQITAKDHGELMQRHNAMLEAHDFTTTVDVHVWTPTGRKIAVTVAASHAAGVPGLVIAERMVYKSPNTVIHPMRFIIVHEASGLRIPNYAFRLEEAYRVIGKLAPMRDWRDDAEVIQADYAFKESAFAQAMQRFVEETGYVFPPKQPTLEQPRKRTEL